MTGTCTKIAEPQFYSEPLWSYLTIFDRYNAGKSSRVDRMNEYAIDKQASALSNLTQLINIHEPIWYVCVSAHSQPEMPIEE